ncbi:8-oxo-dGTP diphosphatase [Virgibacillus sp. 179-BFC.A HS]|uniref:8-oxo-dGTP diphosphatase n=1 Tax=Tigheibacillus jepli TaxID=3035914 RepID=A0ABU5CFF0_9BACI|nr:8-oxo-dGTP diphosphatase [Virgibacillus sp. 179-BFC.A HS]MDY0405016.1 8-oxo-dGTP diphosphatase [Virgibacillus sp. 179-BFC.A HS]
MSRVEQAIFTNMCMIQDAYGRVLVQDRLNPDWPGVTFPGGHVEKGESFLDSVIREVYEETGLTIKTPQLCGIKQFQTLQNERYVVLLYKTGQFEGELRPSKEGNVFWIAREELNNYTLAGDFEKMLQVFETDSLSECYYQGKDESLSAQLL